MKLVLASTSSTRARLLGQLQLPFETASPGINETPLNDEKTADFVRRLALEKARAVKHQFTDALIIGSDQACTMTGLILGKPATEEAAFKHLKLCAGQWLEFHTGLALINTTTGSEVSRVETFRVKFRSLSDEEIRTYVQIDQPLDCAGCFRVESAGICLFEAMEGQDFNTLLGLPMIALVSLLKEQGVSPLQR